MHVGRVIIDGGIEGLRLLSRVPGLGGGLLSRARATPRVESAGVSSFHRTRRQFSRIRLVFD